MSKAVCRPGNTLSEYAVILGLLGVVAIGGLNLLGNSVNGLLGGASKSSGDNSMNHYLDATLGTNSQGGSPPAQLVLANPAGKPGKPDVSGVNLGVGLPSVSDTSTSGTNATSVDGVGMVKTQADRLTQLVRQIQADPDYDPQLLDMVTAMANSGHAAGDKLAAGVAIFRQYRAMLPSKALATGRLSLSLDSASLRDTVQANAQFQSASKSLEQYLAAHPNALSASQLGAIHAATSDIVGMLDTVSDPTKPSTDVTALKQSGWNALAAQSEGVHRDSNTICANGGNQAACVK